MKRVLAAMAMLAGVTGSARAQAPAPGEVLVGDDDCTLGYTVDFGLSATVPDLAAQSELAQASQWVTSQPGRYLRVLRNPGNSADQARLSAVRAAATIQYLTQSGVAGTVITVGDISEVPPNQRQASVDNSTVAILTCVGLVPGH
jgi:hypothetical protein